MKVLATEAACARALDAGAPASRQRAMSPRASRPGAARRVAPGRQARSCSSCSTSRSARCTATASSCATSPRRAPSAAALCSIRLRPRRAAARRRALRELAALEHDAPRRRLRRCSSAAAGRIDLARFEAIYNLTHDRADAALRAGAARRSSARTRASASRERAMTRMRKRVARAARGVSSRAAAGAGQEVETLRKAIAADLLRRRVRSGAAQPRRRTQDRSERLDGALPGHNATANAADERLWQTVRPALEAARLQRAADARARAAAEAQGTDRQGFPAPQGEDRRSA